MPGPLPPPARHWDCSLSIDRTRFCLRWRQPPSCSSSQCLPLVAKAGRKGRIDRAAAAGHHIARRPRSQRGTQLRRVRRRRPDCLARRAQSLHRQPRSRRRDLHARAGHHSIDRRAGRRFDSRGGVECGPEPVAWRGVEVLCVAGIRLGHGTSSRCSALVDSQDQDSAQPRRRSTQLQLRVLRARTILVPSRPDSRSLAAAAAWPGRPVLAGAANVTTRLLGLGDVRPGVRSGGRPLLCDGSLPDASVRAVVRRRRRRAGPVFRPGARPPVQCAAAAQPAPSR